MLSELVKLIDFHEVYRQGLFLLLQVQTAAEFLQLICQPVFFKLQGPTKHSWHTGKATKGKVQDIGEVNKVMPLPLPSSDRVRG